MLRDKLPEKANRGLCFSLAILALVLLSVAANAQWTTPDASNNIHNTNSGNVGVGTSNPVTAVEARGTGSFGGDVLSGAGGLASPFGGVGRIQNLLPNSETIGGTGWALQQGASATQNSLAAPDGNLTAAKLVCGNTNSSAAYVTMGAASGGTYTFSFWAKAGNSSKIQYGIFDLTTTTWVTFITVTDLDSNWRRLAATGTPTAGHTFQVYVYPDTASGTVTNYNYVWGAQLTGSTSPGVYARTAGSSVAPFNGAVVYGNVGIGTANPSNFLTVKKTSSSNGQSADYALAVTQQGANVTGIHLGDFGYGNYSAVQTFNQSLSLNPAGNNVGVGTAAPAYKLDVQGGYTNSSSGYISRSNPWSTSDSAFFPNGISTAGSTNWVYGTTTYINNAPANGWGHQFQGANAYLAIGNGNVGVGTTSPAYKLDVAGNVSATGLCLGGTCKTDWSQVGGGASQWTMPDANNNIHNANTGSVGVGTSSPINKLSVAGGISATGALMLDSTLGSNKVKLEEGTQGSGGTLTLTTVSPSGSGWNTGLFMDNLGQIGIGTTTPSQPLHVHTSATWTGMRVTTAATGATINDGVNFGYDDAIGATIWNREATAIVFSTSNAERMRIDASGNVGVGTPSPQKALDVVGDANVSGTITGGNVVVKYQDVAEWVPSTQKLTAGTVVVLDAGQTNHVLASTKAYDTGVAGVVSDSPGVILGQGGDDKVKVATTGRVKVKVDATRAPIRVGDLLVTSDIEGIAMKSIAIDLGGTLIHRPGTIIGKALEPLDKGTGEILVLLSLQ